MKKITLKNGQKIEMREPKVRDLIAIDDIEGSASRECQLIATLTQQPIEDLQDFSLLDYKLLQDELQTFM